MSALDQIPASAAATRHGDTGSRASKADRVYEALRLEIISGARPPASALQKNEIAARFGASRFPVTTAINRLAYERLVVIEPQRGSFVSRIRSGETKEWMIARRALESEVAAVCAEELTVPAIERLERNLRYQKTAMESRDFIGFHELDVAFHRLLVEGVGLLRLGETLEMIRTHVDRVRQLLLPAPGRIAGTFAEHTTILDAVKAKDAAAAGAAMRRHINDVLDMLCAFEKEHPEFFTR